MFWKLEPLTSVDKFSWIICKNPESVYERELRKGKSKVYGAYKGNSFEGYINNESIDFLATARQLNLSHYVHVQQSAVCPYNLLGFDKTFASAIRGKPVNIDDEHFNTKMRLQCTLGPYPISYEILESWFEKVGITAHDLTPDYDAKVVVLKTLEPMTVTEFLQKIYLISHYLTRKYNLVDDTGDKIEKYVRFCETWLNQLGTERNRFVNGLCRHQKRMTEKFESIVIDNDSELSDVEKTEKLNTISNILHKKGLHGQRHDLILGKIGAHVKTLLELGCGSGQFLWKAKHACKNIKFKGIEINSSLLRKLKSARFFKILNTDIVHPRIGWNDLSPDFLVCTEVIEHLEKQERKSLINLISNLYCPQEFVITTPNREYNQFFPFLEEGEYRHPDHKIEYDQHTFLEEVVTPLKACYDIEFIDIKTEEGITPSWIIYGKRKGESLPDYRLYSRIQSDYMPLHFPISNYTVNTKEMSWGRNSRQMSLFKKNIFYLGHTIAPVDFNPKYPEFLEHPLTALDYYKERGITRGWVEEKYMGSRGYILVFKDQEIAAKVGSDKITVVSRNGYPFFRDQEILDRIHNDFSPLWKDNKYTFMCLDCEIMPWAYKAKELILREFTIPGQAIHLSRLYGGYGDTENSEKYLKALGRYTAEDDIHIKVFNILAAGSVSDKGKFCNIMNGLIQSRKTGVSILSSLNGNTVSHARAFDVDFNTDRDWIVENWVQDCASGIEGYVIKLDNPTTYMSSGYLIQPMLKVRGQDYLRIIYGVDYLERGCYDFLVRRSIKKKRLQAILQHEIGNNILRAFLDQNEAQKVRYLSAFLGSESVNFGKIDATL